MSNNLERRYMTFELRADTESRSVEGYAALYDSPSDAAGWYTEVIAPGAFKRALERGADTVALFNHDDNMVLGRLSAGTVEIWEDDKGLRYKIPDMPQSRDDVLEMIRRGDVKGSSFAFTIKEDSWQYESREGKDWPTRTINEVDLLYDVSPVTYPFYQDTSVFTNSELAKRSFDAWVEDQKKDIEQDNEKTAEEVQRFYEAFDRTMRLKKYFL